MAFEREGSEPEQATGPVLAVREQPELLDSASHRLNHLSVCGKLLFSDPSVRSSGPTPNFSMSCLRFSSSRWYSNAFTHKLNASASFITKLSSGFWPVAPWSVVDTDSEKYARS